MSFKKSLAWMSLLLLSYFAIADVREGKIISAFAQTQTGQTKPPAVELITPEELKAKMDRNEGVTIIDVRNSYSDSDNKIKGAIHVKVRRLKFRLGFPPLKDIPRNSEVVTYCACPSDEASIRAAQILMEAGFKRVHALKNGWQGWLRASGPVEPRPRGM